jgi:hypothetical protein
MIPGLYGDDQPIGLIQRVECVFQFSLLPEILRYLAQLQSVIQRLLSGSDSSGLGRIHIGALVFR